MLLREKMNEVITHILKSGEIIFEDIEIEEYENTSRVVLHLKPSPEVANQCPICGCNCEYYDTPRLGKHIKTWRSLDWGNQIVVIKCGTHRVCCPEHGVVTARIPWAYHDSCFTKEFDQQVTWMATQMSKSAVSTLMRITWPTVGRCITRVKNDYEPDTSARLNGLVQIGIDENAYGKGHNKFVMVVVNHQTNEVVWIKEGRSKECISSFFEELTEEQRKSIELVSADGAEWIHDVVKNYCPQASICLDPFHLFEWITEAENEVRIDVWKDIIKEIKEINTEKMDLKEEAEKDKDPNSEIMVKVLDDTVKRLKEVAAEIKGARYLYPKNPLNLSEEEKLKQDLLMSSSKTLQRVRGRVDMLRSIMHSDAPEQAVEELNKWIRWTKLSRLEPFKKLGKTMENYKESIVNSITYKLSNARVEANNTKIKTLIRRCYGFRNVENLKSMVYLNCSTRYLTLPNRPILDKGVPRWRIYTSTK